MTLEETKKMDQVVSCLFTNIINERSRNDDVIKIVGVDLKDPAHLTYIEVAKIVSDIYQVPIYIELNTFSYCKFIVNNWKRRHQIHKFKNNNSGEVVPVNDMLLFIAKSFDVKYEFFEKIYNAYYKKD